MTELEFERRLSALGYNYTDVYGGWRRVRGDQVSVIAVEALSDFIGMWPALHEDVLRLLVRHDGWKIVVSQAGHVTTVRLEPNS